MTTPFNKQIWDILNVIHTDDALHDTSIQQWMAGVFGKEMTDHAFQEACMLRTLFEMAVFEGLEDLLHQLLQRGFPANIIGDWGTTPLMWATYCGHTQLLPLLIAYGADATQLSFSQKQAQDFANPSLAVQKLPESVAMKARKDQIHEQVLAGYFRPISTTSGGVPQKTMPQRQSNNGKGVDELFKKLQKKELSGRPKNNNSSHL